uniref:Uncharacterized protein n=1 Tax=viral metagenome TaxID=1070528 RepID=A0A6C0IS95_9ZZZZ
MNFQVGDKIYKIQNKEIDTSVIYVIDEIILDDSEANWHDGYNMEYTALVKNQNTGEEEIILLYYSSHIRHFYEKYAIKVEEYK